MNRGARWNGPGGGGGGGLETCACCLVVSVCITAKKGKRERSMSRDFILKGGSFVCSAEKIC